MAMPSPSALHSDSAEEKEDIDDDDFHDVEEDMDDDDICDVEIWPATILSTDPLIHEDSAQVATKLRAIFDSGKPFFTRDAISSIVQSFDKALGQGQEQRLDGTVVVSIPDLVGNVIEFRLGTDTRHLQRRGRTSDTELAITEPCLHYLTIEMLLDNLDLCQFGVEPVCAYLPMMVYFRTEQRNKFTKERVPLWPLSTHDEVAASFQAIRQRWLATEHCAQLTSTLNQHAREIPPDIKKVVAFACSSMAISDPPSLRQTSASQHALVLYMRDFLSSRQDKAHDEIKCYAQDPIYEDVDKSVLGEVGIKVLSDPRGFLEVDEMSVVVSIAPNVPVRHIVMDITRPAIMIWDRVKPYGRLTTDPVSSRVMDIIRREYLELEFPYDREDFGHLCIYVRKK
ncbi:hypothetical protein B0H66DRAFT_378604 [Apodospora peruviana]|uniref:SRR1-like domain-containing protein n=1 Tax=Apodospora peruviana TaxID=516989 RepID=A0AAE0LYK8_9PEZI|nr:hypothetical protein B0H66DRAFT_378604 [Apodospora peruviana]